MTSWLACLDQQGWDRTPFIDLQRQCCLAAVAVTNHVTVQFDHELRTLICLVNRHFTHGGADRPFAVQRCHTGLPRLETRMNPLDFLPRNGKVLADARRIERELTGLRTVEAVVDFGAPGGPIGCEQ